MTSTRKVFFLANYIQIKKNNRLTTAQFPQFKAVLHHENANKQNNNNNVFEIALFAVNLSLFFPYFLGTNFTLQKTPKN